MSQLKDAQYTRKRATVKPYEVKLVSGIEMLAGGIYAANSLSVLTFDIYLSITLAILSLLSFLIAYGLWRLAKWAWFSSITLSSFGIIGGILSILFTGLTESFLFATLPKIFIDLIVVMILLTKDVRVAFGFGF
ncbi:MAG: hypothetical protein ACUVQ5_06245 [Candidatus Methanomethylicaceae archaeon]